MTRRIRAVGEAAVPDWVAREARKFEYPDFDTIAPAVAPGGAGGAPTVVVAASDASDLSKSKADFVCTGTGDEFEIQQALDAYPEGRVLLTEGSFSVAANVINLTGQSTLAGMGPGTILDCVDTTGTIIECSGNWSIIRDLQLLLFPATTNTLVGIEPNNNTWVENVVGENLETFLQNSGASGVQVKGCWADTCNTFVQTFGTIERMTVIDNTDVGAIFINGSVFYTIIENNTVRSGIFVSGALSQSSISGNVVLGDGALDGIAVSAGVDLVIADNVIETSSNGIETIDVQGVAIVGNSISSPDLNGIRCTWTSALIEGEGATVVGNVIRSPGQRGIFVDARTGGGFSQPVVVEGNNIFHAGTDGIHFDDIDEVTVANNTVYESDRHGISTDTRCLRFHVHGNTIIRPGQETDDTYDGIFLNTECDEWFIHGNHILGDASAPQPRYAINISAASDDCNRVVGNNGDGLYASGNINDAGTGTILDWPADPVDGDNIFDCGSPASPGSP